MISLSSIQRSKAGASLPTPASRGLRGRLLQLDHHDTVVVNQQKTKVLAVNAGIEEEGNQKMT